MATTKKAAAKTAAAPRKRTASSSSSPRANPRSEPNPRAKNPASAGARKSAHDEMYASDGFPIFDRETGESRKQYLARTQGAAPAPVDVKAELQKAIAEEGGDK